jgi:hypothetical protein
MEFDKMAIDFGNAVYTSTDGQFTIALADLHANTWLNAFTRAADHVFGNEAISKASTAKAKNGGELADDERAAIVLEARTRYLNDMVAGTWGEKGTRAPRQVGANRLEQIVRNITAADTRKTIAKAGYAAGEAKDTWVTAGGDVFDLATAMTAYRENPELGAERCASIDRRAKAQHDAELVDAAERKAAGEREKTKAPAGAGLSL